MTEQQPVTVADLAVKEAQEFDQIGWFMHLALRIFLTGKVYVVEGEEDFVVPDGKLGDTFYTSKAAPQFGLAGRVLFIPLSTALDALGDKEEPEISKGIRLNREIRKGKRKAALYGPSGKITSRRKRRH